MTGRTYSAEEMLAQLIAFDTTSRDGNLPLIAFVEDYLDGWGVPHFRVDYEANKKTFRDPNNPNLIYPGQVLQIPSIKGEEREGAWDPSKTYTPLPRK